MVLVGWLRQSDHGQKAFGFEHVLNGGQHVPKTLDHLNKTGLAWIGPIYGRVVLSQ